MEFQLTEGQVELQETVARFCEDRFPLDLVGAREGAGVDRSVWAELAELGLLAMLMPAADGDIPLTAVDAAIVFEQLGSHLVPGPVLWTLLAAPLVEGAASGEQVVGGVDADAVVDGGAVVEHAAEIDVVLVVGNDGIVAHDLSKLPTPTPLTAVDPLTTFGRITGLDRGRLVGDSAASDELRSLGTLLTAAMLAGVSSRSLEVARQYALQRHQFNAPIGSFQAVKHMLADMYVRSVSAQSSTYAASAILDDSGSGDPVRAVASAKLLAADAAIANASAAVQLLGGMGFTWNMLPNYLIKRAWALENEFGVVEEHELLLGSTITAVTA